MKNAAIFLTAALLTGCVFTAWTSDGPWACEGEAVCPDGYTCDDGVCCVPGGTPACPTLPLDGGCPQGGALTTWYLDSDGDGVGAFGTGRDFCRAPQMGGWVTLEGDCDDTDELISPRATERCNARDDNCDGVIDDGLTLFSWYLDEDGDGFGDNGELLMACARPGGYADRGGDCDPGDATIFPGAPELCDGIDNNCNGQLDDAPFADAWNPGLDDGDAFVCDTGLHGVCGAGRFQCVYEEGGFVRACTANLFPSVDVCGDGVDNDCDGAADNGPGCGGPADLLTAPGVTMAALRVRGDGGWDPPGCVSPSYAGEVSSWVAPSWLATNSTGEGDLHVLYARPRDGDWWDLSQGNTLRAAADISHIGNVSGFTPDFNLSSHKLPTPTFQFCGEDGGWARATPSSAAYFSTRDIGQGGALHNEALVPLRVSAGAWTVESHGLDWSRVTRVELLATPDSAATAVMTFTLTFDADGGFGFR